MLAPLVVRAGLGTDGARPPCVGGRDPSPWRNIAGTVLRHVNHYWNCRHPQDCNLADVVDGCANPVSCGQANHTACTEMTMMKRTALRVL